MPLTSYQETHQSKSSTSPEIIAIAYNITKRFRKDSPKFTHKFGTLPPTILQNIISKIQKSQPLLTRRAMKLPVPSFNHEFCFIHVKDTPMWQSFLISRTTNLKMSKQTQRVAKMIYHVSIIFHLKELIYRINEFLSSNRFWKIPKFWKGLDKRHARLQ